MKLVIATPLYPPEIGGPATYVKELEEGLPSRGINVTIVKFSDVRHLPKFFRHYIYYRKILAAARDATAILALDPVSVGLPAMKAAKKLGKPFVVKIVGDYAWEQGVQRFDVTQNLDEFVTTKQPSFFVRKLQQTQKYVAQNAIRIMVPSLYLKGIIEKWGIPSTKIEIIYNAVSISEIGHIPERVANLPRPLVVSVGRLVLWKHMDGIINAVAKLLQAGMSISFAVAGSGPLDANLVRYGKSKLLNNFFRTGELSHADTLAVMKSADVFVLNSSYEGLSHVLIEAQMLGIPTIATRVGGNEEIIRNHENGILIPLGDVNALTDALKYLFTNPEMRANIAARAKESAKQFSVETMLSKTAAVLQNL